LKLERWGSLLVQEKYQEEKVCDIRHPYRIIMMMMMVIIIIIIIIIIMTKLTPLTDAHITGYISFPSLYSHRFSNKISFEFLISLMPTNIK